ncbi:DUF4123 domain-containing protein [Pseudomonas sp. GD03860]|uniref:DUF4123 domain-containing protein n=1 Tax=Pseudomonas TaxID=286 RepID=UPI0023643712|nr:MULTISPECIES: DUF4123 domain-containing protein [Pseudomonas]MDD2057374.1 DUF4123 domain-containing protein [Pseudomonas putida]MDH0640333.1 DUF4123 domain-containing protein [Pseudomonas sp. GD03860]
MNQAYLLLDAAQIDNLASRLFELGGGTAFHSLYQQTAYSALAEVSPVLVPVIPNSPLAHTFTCEWSATAGIWLESEAGEAAVLQHLRSLIHARVEGDVTVFFRYYDPRITHLWLTDLEPRVRDSLMGPIQLILLPESIHRGGFIRQENPEQPVAQYADSPGLFLTLEQLNHLSGAKRERLAQRLIEHCRQHFPERLEGLDLAAQLQWASACQRSAERQGYGAVDQVMRWANFHAVLGDEFPFAAEHALYRQILADKAVMPAQRLDNLTTELQRQQLTEREFIA